MGFGIAPWGSFTATPKGAAAEPHHYRAAIGAAAAVLARAWAGRAEEGPPMGWSARPWFPRQGGSGDQGVAAPGACAPAQRHRGAWPGDPPWSAGAAPGPAVAHPGQQCDRNCGCFPGPGPVAASAESPGSARDCGPGSPQTTPPASNSAPPAATPARQVLRRRHHHRDGGQGGLDENCPPLAQRGGLPPQKPADQRANAWGRWAEGSPNLALALSNRPDLAGIRPCHGDAAPPPHAAASRWPHRPPRLRHRCGRSR